MIIKKIMFTIDSMFTASHIKEIILNGLRSPINHIVIVAAWLCATVRSNYKKSMLLP